VIAAVSFVAPWPSLQTNQQFPMAVAFEQALHAHWIVVLIMASALVAMLQAFNANMVTSSRLLFAMSRMNLLNPRLSAIDNHKQTPWAAILAVGIATALTIFLGEALLVPILEVGAVSSALAWMAGCASYYRMKPKGLARAAAISGLLVTWAMVMVKLLPFVPGHFTWHEWVAVAIWGTLGAAVRGTRQRNTEKGSTLAAVDATG
jgi:amino acid transporter